MPRIIDCHVHHLADSDVAWARELGYDKVCLMDPRPEVLAEAKRKHPDFVIPLGWIPLQTDLQTTLDAIDRFRDAGCLGLKACGASARYDDERYEPVWARANEYRLPVFFHTGWLDVRLASAAYRGMERSLADWYHPMTLDRIAYLFPNLPLVAFHMGVTWRAECALLMQQYANVYADTCFGLPQPGETDYFVGQLGGSGACLQTMAKLVYGTDGMSSRQVMAERIERLTALLDALEVPAGVRDRIWYKNALRILGLDDELKKTVRVPCVDARAMDAAKPSAGAVISDFIDTQLDRCGEPGRAATACRVGYDDRALYLAFRCDDANASKLVASKDGPIDNIWEDDCVEVFVSPTRDSNYLHVVANAAGRAGTHRGRTDMTERPEIVSARVTPSRWWLALTLPFDLIGATPKKGDIWGLQLCRNKVTEPAEAVTWSEVATTYHDPSSFGKMVFE